ncbi:p53 and DNA damage-regulated protein [Dirofilaria immitis]
MDSFKRSRTVKCLSDEGTFRERLDVKKRIIGCIVRDKHNQLEITVLQSYQKMDESTEAVLKNLSFDDTTKKMVDDMTEWESLGQNVIMGKRAMIELDERRQKCREALRQLHKQAKNTTNKKSKSWMCFGNTIFVKITTDQAKQMIEDDMKVIETTLEATREEIKNQVDKLKEMENCKSLEELGFNLYPIA